MGLCLFPGDGNLDSPDISWSYSGFGAFRSRLARAEGFDLSDMWGFGGGDKLLLQHVDDGRRLVTVMQLCIEKDVELLFG